MHVLVLLQPLEHTHQLSGATGNNVYVWVYNGTSAKTEHVVYFWSKTSMFSCLTGYTAWILHNTLTFMAPFGFSDSIATFALWVFYGRFGCLLLLVWKTWQHLSLASSTSHGNSCQRPLWVVLMEKIGSINKSLFWSAHTDAMCMSECLVFRFHCYLPLFSNPLLSLIILPRRPTFTKTLKCDA